MKLSDHGTIIERRSTSWAANKFVGSSVEQLKTEACKTQNRLGTFDLEELFYAMTNLFACINKNEFLMVKKFPVKIVNKI